MKLWLQITFGVACGILLAVLWLLIATLYFINTLSTELDKLSQLAVGI